MEQQLAAGLGEWQVTEFIQDQEVEAGDKIGGSSLPLSAGFGVEGRVSEVVEILRRRPPSGLIWA